MLLVDLKFRNQIDNYTQIQIFIDNQSAKTLIENSIHHDRIKHVDIVYHYIKNEIKFERIRLEYIITNTMLVDDLTKSLIKIKYQDFITMLDMN